MSYENFVNQPNSTSNVVSTQALVLDQLVRGVRTEIPEAKWVYDEGLSMKTALESFRANNNLQDSRVDCYPLFAFRRSVLRHCEAGAPGARMISQRVRAPVSDGKSPVYRMVHGAFDLEFLYVTKRIEDMEKFEICYLSEEGLSGNRRLVVDLRPLYGEELEYYVTPKALTDKSIEVEGIYHKGVSGSLEVRGFYPLLVGEGAVIQQIRSRILDLQHGVVFTTRIIS